MQIDLFIFIFLYCHSGLDPESRHAFLWGRQICIFCNYKPFWFNWQRGRIDVDYLIYEKSCFIVNKGISANFFLGSRGSFLVLGRQNLPFSSIVLPLYIWGDWKIWNFQGWLAWDEKIFPMSSLEWRRKWPGAEELAFRLQLLVFRKNILYFYPQIISLKQKNLEF